MRWLYRKSRKSFGIAVPGEEVPVNARRYPHVEPTLLQGARDILAAPTTHAANPA